jgi:hypothetical protein
MTGLLFSKYFTHKTPLLSTFFDSVDVDPASLPKFSNYLHYVFKKIGNYNHTDRNEEELTC